MQKTGGFVPVAYACRQTAALDGRPFRFALRWTLLSTGLPDTRKGFHKSDILHKVLLYLAII